LQDNLQTVAKKEGPPEKGLTAPEIVWESGDANWLGTRVRSLNQMILRSQIHTDTLKRKLSSWMQKNIF